MNDFTGFFKRHFQVLTEQDRETRREAFRLRYQVYCIEKEFEHHQAFADGEERDRFDPQSLHGVVKHRHTDTAMGTVRLVRRHKDNVVTGFPLEHSKPTLLSRHGITERVLPRATTAEISRFAISKDYRRGIKAAPAQGNDAMRAGAFRGRIDRPSSSLLTFGLCVALMRLSAAHNITHWLAIMEPSLLRLLARFGVEFTPIGELIDYHGRRQPCYGRVDYIRDQVGGVERDLFDLVANDIAGQHPRPAASSSPGRLSPGMS